MNGERLIPLGVIATAHGVRGQVKIRSFTANPEDLTAYGPLTDAKGRMFDIRIVGQANGALIAGILGITSRNEAEALRNVELCVPRSALPAPQKGEYYYEDLAGLKLVTQDGEAFGIIKAVHNFGAGDLVEVVPISGEEEFIPFSRTTFPHIDIARGTAVIVPPEICS